jgi:hypothetical protein
MNFYHYAIDDCRVLLYLMHIFSFMNRSNVHGLVYKKMTKNGGTLLPYEYIVSFKVFDTYFK